MFGMRNKEGSGNAPQELVFEVANSAPVPALLGLAASDPLYQDHCFYFPGAFALILLGVLGLFLVHSHCLNKFPTWPGAPNAPGHHIVLEVYYASRSR